jgi:RNA polymerase sigma-70 factor, ECF subfamily
MARSQSGAGVSRDEPRRGAPSLDERVRGRIDAGDLDGALTEALRELGPEVLGFLARVMGNAADAEEVFAAVAERFWKGLARFRWRCSLRTWMYVIAKREIDRYRRRARAAAPVRISTSKLEKVVAEVTTLSGKVWREIRDDAVARLRKELPEGDRFILTLRLDRGMAWEEIALAFLDPDECTERDVQRESARLRQRFQLIKRRLAVRAKEEGLLEPR